MLAAGIYSTVKKNDISNPEHAIVVHTSSLDVCAIISLSARPTIRTFYNTVQYIVLYYIHTVYSTVVGLSLLTVIEYLNFTIYGLSIPKAV